MGVEDVVRVRLYCIEIINTLLAQRGAHVLDIYMRDGFCRAAKNSDFVRVIGFFNPPLRVRTDIYAINDLF